jgi:hypothetical protein
MDDYNMGDYKMTGWCERAAAHIKYKPDRKAVEAELLAHMQDKQKALAEGGMLLQEAANVAVVAMGDADEVGRELAKIHKPFFGYLLTATKVLLVIAIVSAVIAVFGAKDRLGIFAPADTSGLWEKLFTDEIRESETEGSWNYQIRTLYLEPDCTDKSDGYTFTVPRAVEWYGEWRHELDGDDVSGEGYTFFLDIKASHPLPWAGFPEAVSWFTAIDSLGNTYNTSWKRGYTYDLALIGNAASRTLFTYTYEMWLDNYVPGAEWVELRYDREGRNIALRIDLTEDNK